MIIIHTVRMSGPNADVSYNAAWQGCWAYAEISLGLIVTCTIALPRLIEAKGKRLRAIISSISGPFRYLVQLTSSTNNDASTYDRVATNYPRLGTELDPETSDHGFEALRDAENWSNVSVNPIH